MTDSPRPSYQIHLERDCECPQWPSCVGHRGGPDTCDPHEHRGPVGDTPDLVVILDRIVAAIDWKDGYDTALGDDVDALRAALAADAARPDVPQPFAMARLGLYEPPTAEARPGLADVRQRVLVLQARWMLSEGDEADARCGAYDDVLDIIDHALTEKRP